MATNFYPQELGSTSMPNAIRFYMESGNIASGEIVMYGIANGT